MASQFSLPQVPAKHKHFLNHVQSHPDTPVEQLLEPYNRYDSVLRKVFAQEPCHPALEDGLLNVVPLFDETGSADVRVRARDLESEPPELKEKYIMQLKDDQRRPNGSPAVVSTIKEFQTNFNLFSETSLIDLDWNNVVAAGSAVVTSLMPVPEEYNGSKRGLRQYYHEKFAPASDVDLFLYGLTEEQAVEKIKQIETKMKGSILAETTSVRTKNAITIVSQYPTRHVQIVLRIYRSIAEILTGFDVDCSCAAYDGRQVYAAPRALASYITQVNRIDLSRRSPSYENRLSKYSHRGFEVFWPQLDRSKIDPTIFERSFTRVVGLARLLILERLPRPADRDLYLEKRRTERGRPAKPWRERSRLLRGNIKNDWDDEVPDWLEDDISDYHTFTIPYGPRFHAKKIEKLMYTKDLLLNAEWNKPKDREVNLHRHPAFFGDVEDIIDDCCGQCPQPVAEDEIQIAEEESKIYVSGDVSFIKDNPGRQAIGSFNPITETDWTEMAYVGNTERLCQAIVEHDLQTVRDWLNREDADPNRRDYTGRTPLHLAVMASTPEIVQCLVDHGARLIARLADGRTALHIAAANGNVEIVRILLTKSGENEAEEEKKKEAEAARRRFPKLDNKGNGEDGEDVEMLSYPSSEAEQGSYATGSFVNVRNEPNKDSSNHDTEESNELDPDIYDINVLAWDSRASPLHLAILNGHVDVVEELVSSFGADPLLPIKLVNNYNSSPRAAILTLVLALRPPLETAKAMTAKLLQLGASAAQADLKMYTPLHYLSGSTAHTEIFDILLNHDKAAVKRAINHLAGDVYSWNSTFYSALTIAIYVGNSTGASKLLDFGANTEISLADYIKSLSLPTDSRHRYWYPLSAENKEQKFRKNVPQPVIFAVSMELPLVALQLLDKGADPNTLAVQEGSWTGEFKASLLDKVRSKIDKLRKYDGQEVHLNHPERLELDDGLYLGGCKEGSYKYFYVKEQLTQKRKQYESTKRGDDENVAALEKREGLVEKQAAIDALLLDFEKLEAALVERGAKTFEELFPESKAAMPPIPQASSGNSQEPKPKPFKIPFNFGQLSLTEEQENGYLRLFEAAWSGDIDTIKELTLAVWGPENDQTPLKIAIRDGLHLSPFAVAVLRGHRAAAKVILDIARAQHKPKTPEQRFVMMEDIDDDNDVQLYSEIVDDKFTIENIGEIATKVESDVSALDYFGWWCPAYLFADRETGKKDASYLLTYAIAADDVDLLSFLLDLGQDVVMKDAKTRTPTVYQVPHHAFKLAIKLGRLGCLSEIIKRSAAGLPLDELVESSGVVVKEKPKYYQGLSIRGRKRADWAAAGRHEQKPRNVKSYPPLLISAFQGNISSVEWFLGTAPERHYMEFVETHKNDKRVERLSQSKQGIERCITSWLHLRENLVLHCAVLSTETEECGHLIRYLVKHAPECLETRSAEGYTPLALAFSLQRPMFARILVDSGANQTVRDLKGNNILHLLLCDINGQACMETKYLQRLLDLIDPLLMPSLLTERSSDEPGSLTPLSRWIHKANSNMNYRVRTHRYFSRHDRYLETDNKVAVLRLIIDFAEPTGQKHLELLDAAGNTPVHDIIRYQLPKSLELALDRRPDLLHRENATGCTPLELAVDAWINEGTCNPPNLPGSDMHHAPEMNTGIVRRAPSLFVQKNSSVDEERSERTKICDLCRQRANTRPDLKRKLVSLYEVNEVAKRLASMQVVDQAYERVRHRRMWYGDEDDDDAADEVALWYGKSP
ncbi:hypothetical protein MPDQ_003589 [Monascus purpureus]|uniref:Ankyrin repeat protein n=1 Tax=Monascus purpureus TaxID=5098 RepID=A0A507QMW5_MONPU|nr:hypothetical protein MPDQ_003589 [Monascus purpureus]BDD60444.1 hypothetical protein MAP00_005572 [Monascus purpureus]